uniref:Reverse transcriptase domain-containing protein n=1 Tax=Ananas comosus var. bracteatus TaxID=296719 RepID=A0A6V7Q9G4_ANACO|nr:unnamed protein product [Ananas comosus var. bracteatus]
MDIGPHTAESHGVASCACESDTRPPAISINLAQCTDTWFRALLRSAHLLSCVPTSQAPPSAGQPSLSGCVTRVEVIGNYGGNAWDALSRRLAARFWGSSRDYLVANFAAPYKAVFFPNWVARESAISRSPLSFENFQFKLANWTEAGELERGTLPKRPGSGYTIGLSSAGTRRMSKPQLVTLGLDDGLARRVSHRLVLVSLSLTRTSGLKGGKITQEVKRVKRARTGVVLGWVTPWEVGASHRIPIEIESWEETNPIFLGEDLDERLGLVSTEAQERFIRLTGFASIPPRGSHEQFRSLETAIDPTLVGKERHVTEHKSRLAGLRGLPTASSPILVQPAPLVVAQPTLDLRPSSRGSAGLQPASSLILAQPATLVLAETDIPSSSHNRLTPPAGPVHIISNTVGSANLTTPTCSRLSSPGGPVRGASISVGLAKGSPQLSSRTTSPADISPTPIEFRSFRRNLRLASKNKGIAKSSLQRAQDLMCSKLKLVKFSNSTLRSFVPAPAEPFTVDSSTTDPSQDNLTTQDYRTLDADGTRGGLLTAWNNVLFDCIHYWLVLTRSTSSFKERRIRRRNPTLERLDRALISQDWILSFPRSTLKALLRPRSDHSPLVLTAFTFVPTPRLFQFESFWLCYSSLSGVVSNAWNSVHYASDPAKRFTLKIDSVRNALQHWSLGLSSGIKKQASLCLQWITWLDLAEETRMLSSLECNLRLKLKVRYEELCVLDELKWKQRSRVQWLREGDANTRFFHIGASCRRSRNNIHQLSDDTNTLSSPNTIADNLISFFHIMPDSVHSSHTSINFSSIFIDEALDLSSLNAPFSSDEVKMAIFSCALGKAPGPDGLPMLFYHRFWSLLQNDIMDVFNRFHNGLSDLSPINSSWICPIPKKPAVSTAKDLRPISLVHSMAKIISKVLACWLQSFMNLLINPFQTAFIKGRHILDNFYCAHILIHHLHVSKTPAAVFQDRLRACVRFISTGVSYMSFSMRGALATSG